MRPFAYLREGRNFLPWNFPTLARTGFRHLLVAGTAHISLAEENRQTEDRYDNRHHRNRKCRKRAGAGLVARGTPPRAGRAQPIGGESSGTCATDQGGGESTR